MAIDPEYLKELAKEHGVTMKSVTVLECDPFYILDAAQVWGHWFVEVWNKLGLQHPQYLHNIHYKMISREKGKKFHLPENSNHKGAEYQNLAEHDAALAFAGKIARYMGLIPCDWIIDARASEPRWHYLNVSSEVAYEFGEPNPYFATGAIVPAFPPVPELNLETFTRGCVPQPYVLEIWCEKSNPEPILTPICVKYGVNLVLGVGQMSITEVYELVERAANKYGKPVRIFYISNFDPAGCSMPVAVARKIEWFKATDYPDIDIKLYYGMLTEAQCIEYKLPRTPIKSTSNQKESWESRFGEDATELDAMTELKLKEFKRIIVDWIKEFYDEGLNRRVHDRNEEIADDLKEAIDSRNTEVQEHFADRIEKLRQE